MTAGVLETGVAPDSFLALLDDVDRSAVLDLGVARAFPRGAVLMFEREPGERLMILLAGRVKVAAAGENGHDVLLSIRDPGDVLGELAFIDGEPHSATVSALEPVKAVVISSRVFRAHLETAPRVAVAMVTIVTRRLRETTVKRSQFSADTIARLAARLVELADRYGADTGDGLEIGLVLSQHELAEWTGASRAGLAKAMQTLRELGWIETQRRRIVIRDIDALRRRAA